MRFSYLHTLVAFIVAVSQMRTHEYPTKDHPSFGPKIENRQLQIITGNFFKLSDRNNIHFDKNVTIGFSTITKERVIGLCSYRPGFREIDLDSTYWQNATWTTKVALVFHEMTHCYCGRNHDFGNGTMYPDGSLQFLLQHFLQRQPFTPLRPPGYLNDNCPQSIMHPIIMTDTCFQKHYSYYVHEMFVRCQPY
jgi:hypothetical protein